MVAITEGEEGLHGTDADMDETLESSTYTMDTAHLHIKSLVDDVIIYRWLHSQCYKVSWYLIHFDILQEY